MGYCYYHLDLDTMFACREVLESLLTRYLLGYYESQLYRLRWHSYVCCFRLCSVLITLEDYLGNTDEYEREVWCRYCHESRITVSQAPRLSTLFKFLWTHTLWSAGTTAIVKATKIQNANDVDFTCKCSSLTILKILTNMDFKGLSVNSWYGVMLKLRSLSWHHRYQSFECSSRKFAIRWKILASMRLVTPINPQGRATQPDHAPRMNLSYLISPTIEVRRVSSKAMRTEIGIASESLEKYKLMGRASWYD